MEPQQIFEIFERPATSRGSGCGGKTSLPARSMYFRSAPCPSTPCSGVPAEKTSPPHSQSENSAPQATAATFVATFAATGELLQSTWFFLTTQLPVPSCPLALEPHRKLWPPAMTAAECFLPAAIWGGDRLGWSAK